jgi:5-methylcytosine-specific restriction endonuclease McrA
MALKRTTKLSIWRRDKFICKYCGHKVEIPDNNRRASDYDASVDHVVARIRGGGNERSNLVTACRKCNNEKSKGENKIILNNGSNLNL